MSREESQIVVPPSFTALFVPLGRHKPTESYAVIEQRYELCEDFAQMLVDQARAQQWALGITQEDVLERMTQGLSASDVFSPDESGWVLKRLAELLSLGGH
jgi:hypothetical protein